MTIEKPEITCNFSRITFSSTRLDVYRNFKKPKTQALSEIRRSMELSQSNLARRTGLNQSTIHYYEKGLSFPTLDKAVILAEALGISLDELAKSMGLISDDVIR